MNRYLATDFLAIYVAILAVIASQFPPVSEYFRRAVVDVKLDGGSIYHNLGRIEWLSEISVSNYGSKAAFIRNVECSIYSRAIKLADMFGYYYPNYKENSYITPTISLHKNTTKQLIYYCLQEMPQHFFDAAEKIRNEDPTNSESFDMESACDGKTNPLNEQLVESASSLFDQFFVLKPGTLTLEMRVFDFKGNEIGGGRDEVHVTQEALSEFSNKSQFQYSLAPSFSCGKKLHW